MMKLFSRRKLPDNYAVDINFDTDTKEHGHTAPFIGVYQGSIPQKLGKITFGNLPIGFRNADTIEKIHTAALAGDRIRARQALVDCFGFVALFSEEVEESAVPDSAQQWVAFDIGDTEITPDDVVEGGLYVLGSKYHDNNLRPRHGVIATEIEDGFMYFHILGDNGPLALSELPETKSVFNTNSMRTIENIRLVV